MNQRSRFRAFLWFLIGACYFYVARDVAVRIALGLGSGVWLELINRAVLLILLIAGYAGMAYVGQKQRTPIKLMGLARRSGWQREVGLGAAIGWGGMVACVLPVALSGGLIVTFFTGWAQLPLLVLDVAILAIAALAEEVAFRGYPFQRLIEAIGPVPATLLLSVVFALIHLGNPGSTAASTFVTFLAGCLLSVAWLRTRALWVGWGFHLGWNISMGILFGLPISGLTNFSPVILSNTFGPAWLTGADYGPEGSAICVLVLLALLVVVTVATGDLKHLYAQPVVVPGGFPVDLDAIARRQHEAAMGPAEPVAPQLIQIGGIAAAPRSESTIPAPAENPAPNPPQES
ncbi:lysostaphin resistance A-like protein [Silvibacterium sp.]|uniref:CPBP family intramembrane glutamic endopeptidase n=1 Tax=Silvibacterium sp. TaxID=1964179 RepID=UPI0039E280B9